MAFFPQIKSSGTFGHRPTWQWLAEQWLSPLRAEQALQLTTVFTNPCCFITLGLAILGPTNHTWPITVWLSHLTSYGEKESKMCHVLICASFFFFFLKHLVYLTDVNDLPALGRLCIWDFCPRLLIFETYSLEQGKLKPRGYSQGQWFSIREDFALQRTFGTAWSHFWWFWLGWGDMRGIWSTMLPNILQP